MVKPLCFVLMPFGLKPDPTGRPQIDFNRVYDHGIRPAVEDAGMVPVRADEEKTGGIIHKPMFERLLLCEYAVADLTTANANVFYELGVRHTARPRSTQPIFAKHQPIPFDVNYLRALGYDLGDNNAFGDNEASALRSALRQRLTGLRDVAQREAESDSPVFQLLPGWQAADLSHMKTDVFHEQIMKNQEWKSRMDRARKVGKNDAVAELRTIESELGDLDRHEVDVVVDLMLAYRAQSAWTNMIELYDKMPKLLQNQIMVREQLAFALNRRATDNDRERALEILKVVENQKGSNPETSGLIGRIYKDLFDAARSNNRQREARGYLKESIEAYMRGFEADLRDTYPGINAATLLDVQGDKEKRDKLVPVVTFAIEQRLRAKEPDYWDYATMLELAVLGNNLQLADHNLDCALAKAQETWMPQTTSRNLGLIREYRAQRGEDVSWLNDIIAALDEKVRQN